MSHLPIADYAMIADCRTAALVSREGSVDWLCFARFDAPSVFARLLDRDAGHFSIRPAAPFTVARRYLPGTLVVETTFRTGTGTAVLRDALALGLGERGHEIGKAPPRMLLRHVRCVEGEVELALELAPRPEYGLVFPLLRRVEGGVAGRGGASRLRLSTDIPCDFTEGPASARFTLRAGQATGFALQQRFSWEDDPELWDQDRIVARLEDTIAAWESWTEQHQGYRGPWEEEVRFGGRVLQGLTYQPTGAIVAAATTSLPESVGGSRNWDYRYSWVRDASLTLEALWVAACPDEAEKYFDFLTAASLGHIRRGADLQIMFGVGGEHDLSERELQHLRGWRGSRPVRVGNAAWNQRQLDIHGELLGAAWRLREKLGALDDVTCEFLVEVAEAAAASWKEPDQGIWEVRGPPRHFLHSKLMCWVALDRAIGLAPQIGAEDRTDRWAGVTAEIREAILREGYSERAGAFTGAFGSEELDASALVLPIVGFLPVTDPRIVATVDAIRERLVDERGLVYRYRGPDGVEGTEGAFLLCTFWLAEVLAMMGHVDEARATFERAASHRNDLGLLAEEVDPATGELLGNFPQAFSHVGLINAAWAIARASGAA